MDGSLKTAAKEANKRRSENWEDMKRAGTNRVEDKLGSQKSKRRYKQLINELARDN